MYIHMKISPSSSFLKNPLPSDAAFLLRFLRHKKYKVKDAQEHLEKYLKMRQDQAKWFKNLDVTDTVLEDLIDRGFFFVLPQKDRMGRRVFVNRTGKCTLQQELITDNRGFFFVLPQ